MPDWLIAHLGALQGGIVRSLAAELRAGGLGTVALISQPDAITNLIMEALAV